MQIMIECEYCGSTYYFDENHVCPNCAAIPDKKKLKAAKAAAKAEKLQQSVNSAYGISQKDTKPPSGMFITVIVKLIPFWIFLIIGLCFVPDMNEKSISKRIMKNYQVIDEINYVDHSINEKFLYDDKITLEINDVFISDSDIVKAILPDDKKLLVVHIKGSVDESYDDDYSYYRYSNVTPYVKNGSYCREKLNYSALNSIPEVYTDTVFSLNFDRYSTNTDGYWCFIIDETDSNLSLCIGDFKTDNDSLHLEKVHKINITIEEEEH